MSLRDGLARWMVGTGVASVVDFARTKVRRDLRVLAYHRVLPRQDEAAFKYDLELISAWEDDFDWQVKYLARNHDVITCIELARRLDAGIRLTGRELIITFDDGYRDNHSVVLPVLKRHGVPAVVFVATGYMDRPDTFWYDALVRDVLRSGVGELRLGLEPDGGPVLKLGETGTSRRAAATALLSHLKLMSDGERLESLQRWTASLEVPTCEDSGPNGPLTWHQVRELAAAGVEIGSHSVSHPILSRVNDPTKLHHELFESKAAIERETGQPVISLAYPVGGRLAYSDQVIAEIKKAGYRYAFTYESGTNHPANWDLFRMDRLRVERYLTRQRFIAQLAAPSLFP